MGAITRVTRGGAVVGSGSGSGSGSAPRAMMDLTDSLRVGCDL